jgi:hypothetical protein
MLYVIDDNLKQPGIRGMAPLAAASDLGASFLD